MGDRVFVQINVRKSDLKNLMEAEGINTMECLADTFHADDYGDVAEGVTMFSNSEVNYAEWEELEGTLIQNSIPYDKSYSAGGSFPGGIVLKRMINGKYEEVEYADNHEVLIETIQKLDKSKDNYEDLLKIIEEEKSKWVPFEVIPLSALKS